jgi:hypothetical protein
MGINIILEVLETIMIETRNALFFLLGGWGEGRRKNFMGMVSNSNVVKLINYV